MCVILDTISYTTHGKQIVFHWFQSKMVYFSIVFQEESTASQQNRCQTVKAIKNTVYFMIYAFLPQQLHYEIRGIQGSAQKASFFTSIDLYYKWIDPYSSDIIIINHETLAITGKMGEFGLISHLRCYVTICLNKLLRKVVHQK